MTDTIGKIEFRTMFVHAAACLINEQQRLTELDSVGGDGDHGRTMLAAAEQMKQWPSELKESLPVLLKATGWRVLGVDGGASSALLGTFFAGMGEAPVAGDSVDCRGLAQIFQAGLDAVARQTKARIGDKTMMDALIPAVDALNIAAAGHKTTAQALHDAALAAYAGAESTKELIARHGRARSLGERTRGHQDAGATSIALIFKGFSEAHIKRA
jgi:dihydroxyacetone kinase-like protein